LTSRKSHTPDTHVANFEFPGGEQITWQGLSCNKHLDSSAIDTFHAADFIAKIRSGDHFGVNQGDEAAMAFWMREYQPGWTPVV
jgi:hypothetical protein